MSGRDPAMRPTGHICHAHGCAAPVAPSRLMCRRHWFMVPKDLRDAVWRAYRPGQERDKKPSADYLAAAKAAIEAVYRRERAAPQQAQGELPLAGGGAGARQ